MMGKAELMDAIAGKNRGLLATGQQAILMRYLEDRNPTPSGRGVVRSTRRQLATALHYEQEFVEHWRPAIAQTRSNLSVYPG